MCEIDIVDFPGRRVVNGIVEPNPEESELVAERTVFFIFQVASVIPPFDAELIVREIITGSACWNGASFWGSASAVGRLKNKARNVMTRCIGLKLLKKNTANYTRFGLV